MATFRIQCNGNAVGFGPNWSDTSTLSSCLSSVYECPFEPTIRSEALGRICDFTFATKQKTLREMTRWGLSAQNEEEFGFQPADTRMSGKMARHHFMGQSARLQQTNKKLVKDSTEAFIQKQQQELALQLGKKKKSEIRKQQAAQKAKQLRNTTSHRHFGVWSIEPTADWKTILTFELNKLTNKTVDPSQVKVEEVAWRGILKYYNKQIDRTSPKSPVPLTDTRNKCNFYWPTTTADEIIQETVTDPNLNVNVAATAQILAVLMSAPQSRYSWHLNVIKVEGKLLFDKAENTIIDMVSVNETSAEMPSPDAENRLNRPATLGIEALKVNQNFCQHVLEDTTAHLFEPPPFIEDDEDVDSLPPANMAYRYRIFTIPGKANAPTKFAKNPIRLVTRADVHSCLKGANTDSYAALYTVNEYDIKLQKNWRTQIDNQQGALLATEIANNGCRLQKYVASALLAGCDTMKIGFATRRGPNDAERHLLLLVQSLKTGELGAQIGLKMNNGWGIVRHIIDMIMEMPDGRYILLKDPTKQILRLYLQQEEDEIRDEQPEKTDTLENTNTEGKINDEQNTDTHPTEKPSEHS